MPCVMCVRTGVPDVLLDAPRMAWPCVLCAPVRLLAGWCLLLSFLIALCQPSSPVLKLLGMRIMSVSCSVLTEDLSMQAGGLLPPALDISPTIMPVLTAPIPPTHTRSRQQDHSTFRTSTIGPFPSHSIPQSCCILQSAEDKPMQVRKEALRKRYANVKYMQPYSLAMTTAEVMLQPKRWHWQECAEVLPDMTVAHIQVLPASMQPSRMCVTISSGSPV